MTVSVSGASDRTFLTYMGANRELPAMLQQVASRGDFAKARHIQLAFATKPAEADNLFTEVISQGCTLSVDAMAGSMCLLVLMAAHQFFYKIRPAPAIIGWELSCKALPAIVTRSVRGWCGRRAERSVLD